MLEINKIILVKNSGFSIIYNLNEYTRVIYINSPTTI
jgi:hypothetical protein